MRLEITLVSLAVAASLAGCAKRDAPKVMAQGTLAVEIRQSVDVTVSLPKGDALDVDLKFLEEGEYVYLDPKIALHAQGHLESYPEASMTMVTARFALPAMPMSPCGASEMSGSLALARRGNNDRVSGGLTVYCGAGVFSGIPKRVFRFTGSLPLSP